jgi:hypothetical protein
MNDTLIPLKQIAERFKIDTKIAYRALLNKGNKDRVVLMSCSETGELYTNRDIFGEILSVESELSDMVIDLAVLDKRSTIPFKPDKYVYFLFDSGSLVYIGRSAAIAARIGTHIEDKVFDKVAWVTRRDYEIVENVNIFFYYPKYNKSVWTHAERFGAILNRCIF